MSRFGSMIKAVFGAPAPAVTAPPAPAGAPWPVVIPQARDRWLSPLIRTYTPENIETYLRGAMSGHLLGQWELFDLMEDTWPRLQKNLAELKRTVRSLEWQVQPWAPKGEQPSPEAQRRAKLFEEVLWTMCPNPDSDENAFGTTLDDIMDAWGKGISVLEIDWEVRPHQSLVPGPATIIAPKATRWIKPRYYGYPLTGTRLMLKRTEQGVNHAALNPSGARSTDEYAPFPDNKFVIATCKQKSGHPVRGALLRPLAFWWIASNYGAEWLLNFSQIFGVPFRWATYDPNRAGLLDKVADMLTNLGSAGWAAMPAGTTLELKEAAKSGADNPQAYLIALADRICDTLVLGQTLTTDAGDRGTQALGTVHQGIRADIIDAAAEWVAEVLNTQFVPAFCRLNFGDAQECPWLMPSRKQVKDSKALAERDEILLRNGVSLPRAWFYDRHDVPLPAEGEEVITAPSQPHMTPFGEASFALGRPDAPTLRRFDALTLGRSHAPTSAINARASDEAVPELVRQAVADAADARVRWLEPLQEELDRLVAVIRDEKLTDRELTQFLEAAAQNLPDLFAKLNINALSDSLESALGAAALRGVRDALKS